MRAEFLILVDRGNVRAYRVGLAAAARGARPRVRMRLAAALTLVGAHLSPGERFSDQDGAFPVAGRAGAVSGRDGMHQNSAAERHWRVEEDRRLVRLLVGHLEALLEGEVRRLRGVGGGDGDGGGIGGEESMGEMGASTGIGKSTGMGHGAMSEPLRWALAVPADMHLALLEELERVAPIWSGRLVECVPSDLVKVPVARLAAHFESCQESAIHLP